MNIIMHGIKKLGFALPLLVLSYLLLSQLGLSQNGVATSVRALSSASQPHQVIDPFVIFEQDFDPDSWDTTVQASSGATFTATQQLESGNPGAFRRISHTLPPVAPAGTASITVDHIYNQSTYNPATLGAIASINYLEHGRILTFPFANASVTARPIIVQDGRTFQATEVVTYTASNASHNWETKSYTLLTADDFVAADGSGTKPNFSTNGAPMRFGFSRANNRTSTVPPLPADQPIVLDHGIDNWQVVVNRVVSIQVQAFNDQFVLDSTETFHPLYVTGNDVNDGTSSLKIISTTEPLRGEASPFLDGAFIMYNAGSVKNNDSFDYTIQGGNSTSSAHVELYFDCACITECLGFAVTSGLVPAADNIDLSLIYGVRDQVLKPTYDGQRYVDMYYQSNPEILFKIMANEPLRAEAVATVELWQDTLRNLVQGDGSAVITQAQMDALATFLNNLSAVASDELKTIIANERARLGPFDDYVGLTAKEAKRTAIGDARYYIPTVHAE